MGCWFPWKTRWRVSVVRVYDLLLESKLEMCGETILPIEHQLMGMAGSEARGFEGSGFASDGAGAMRAIFFPGVRN